MNNVPRLTLMSQVEMGGQMRKLISVILVAGSLYFVSGAAWAYTPIRTAAVWLLGGSAAARGCDRRGPQGGQWNDFPELQRWSLPDSAWRQDLVDKGVVTKRLPQTLAWLGNVNARQDTGHEECPPARSYWT